MQTVQNTQAAQAVSAAQAAYAAPVAPTTQNTQTTQNAHISAQIDELRQQIADLTQQLVHERLRSSAGQNEQILQKLNQTLERDLKETAARLDQVQNERDGARVENERLRAEN